MCNSCTLVSSTSVCTPERQSLFASHRQSRWLTSWSYRYNANDLNHLTLIGAWDSAGAIVGAAAWESAIAAETPNGARGLLLHGIYVMPGVHRNGVGTRLLDAAIESVHQGGFDGLLIKANPNARAFFTARGLQQLSIEDAQRDYPYRFWINLMVA